MKKLVIGILAAISVSTAHGQGITIMLNMNCGNWFEQATSFGAKGWVLGYLSGVDEIWVSEANGFIDPLAGISNTQVTMWMDNYCHANPLSNLRVGAATLFAELVQRKRSEMPPATKQ